MLLKLTCMLLLKTAARYDTRRRYTAWQHADQPPGRNRLLQNRLRDSLNNLVVVTHNAHTVANSIITEAVENVLSHIAGAK